jgi:hypothetical protein
VNPALHLRGDLQAVAVALEELLLPDSSAVVWQTGDWVSVAAEQLSEDLADIAELSEPLSEQFGTVWAHTTLYHRFEAGAFVETVHAAPPGLPLEQNLEALPAGAIRVTREPEKPGMAEFFGRSTDE